MDKDVYDLIKRKTQDETTSWLADGLIYLVESGSRAYGTNTEKSDRDYKGIVVPPLGYHIGTQVFKSVNISTGNDTSKNTKEDIDVTLYSLKYFMELASRGNPQLLEMLYVDEANILVDNKELRENRGMFVTKYLANNFMGFATTLTKDFNKKLSKGIFDGKALMNLVRIYEMGTEALATGSMSTKRPNPDELLRLRKMSLDEVDEKELGELYRMLKEKKETFRKAEEESTLSKRVNAKKVEEVLIRLTLENVDFNM